MTEKVKNFGLVPLDVGIQILVRLEGDDDQIDFEAVGRLLGFDRDDLESLRTSQHFKRLKFSLLERNHNLLHLFEGGHKRRVKKYNLLVRRLILRSPERFSSLKAPYTTHKFLIERDSEDSTREPAYYYPIDKPSVEFWNQVYETQRLLTRFKVSAFWRQREKRAIEEAENRKCVDDCIASKVFRMNHQYAKIILLHKFNEVK